MLETSVRVFRGRIVAPTGMPVARIAGVARLDLRQRVTNATKGGLFLNNRHYDPTTGVFVSVDPLVTLTGEPHVYGASNPITFSSS